MALARGALEVPAHALALALARISEALDALAHALAAPGALAHALAAQDALA